MKKSSKIIIGLLILILVLVLVIGGYTIVKLSSTIAEQSDGGNIQISSNKKEREMTSDEIERYEEFFNDSLNGFIVSTNNYEKPSEINLNELFYNTSVGGISEEEILEYSKVEEYMHWDMRKITTEEAKRIYENNTGEELTNLRDRLNEWVYLEKYDAYYMEAGDTNHEFVKVISGTVDDSNVIYDDKTGFENGTAYYTINLSNGDKVKLKEVYFAGGVEIHFISNMPIR